MTADLKLHQHVVIFLYNYFTFSSNTFEDLHVADSVFVCVDLFTLSLNPEP